MLTVNRASKIILERDKALRDAMVDKLKEEDAKSLLKSALDVLDNQRGEQKDNKAE